MSGTAASTEFEAHRPVLLGLAYRMLGEIASAEDAVQETYIRWHRIERQTITAPRAWLLTTCARLCIDELRSARVRRETYVGPWLPEPLIEPEAPADPVERQQSLSIAFLLLLERLNPVERAAFVLRDVLELDYSEIAQALGKSEAACRQIVSRSSRRLADSRRPERPDLAATSGFAAALASGDAAALMRLLAPDAVLLSDGGGKVVSALNPIEGATRIVRFLLGVARKAGNLRIEPRRINGTPGFLVRRQGNIFGVIDLDIVGTRVAAIHIVRNPDKLTRIGGGRVPRIDIADKARRLADRRGASRSA